MSDRKRPAERDRITSDKPAKTKSRRLRTRKRAGKRSPEIQDYEPPTRPLSKSAARGVFLRLLASEKPQTVTALFDLSYESFLRLNRHSHPSVISGEEPYTDADVFQFGVNEFGDYQSGGSLRFLEQLLDIEQGLLETIQSIGGNTIDQATNVEDLKRLVEEMRQFHHALGRWRSECQMDGSATDWFCDFGVCVLRRFWETDVKPLPSRPIITRLARRDEMLNPANQAADNVLEPERMKNAWLEAVGDIEKGLAQLMKAPENELSNIFRLDFNPGGFWDTPPGFWPTNEFLEPKERPIQAPVAADGLPTISGEFHDGNVQTFEAYQWLVRNQLEHIFQESPLRYLDQSKQERIIKQSLQACFPAMADYWQRYGQHLQRSGWKVVLKKDQLEKHCKWLIWNLHGWSHETIARRARSKKSNVTKSNVTKRIGEIKPLLGLTKGIFAEPVRVI